MCCTSTLEEERAAVAAYLRGKLQPDDLKEASRLIARFVAAAVRRERRKREAISDVATVMRRMQAMAAKARTTAP